MLGNKKESPTTLKRMDADTAVVLIETGHKVRKKTGWILLYFP